MSRLESYRLSSEFVDESAERALIGSIFKGPEIYFQVIDYLSVKTFAVHGEVFEKLAIAIEDSEPLQVTPDFENQSADSPVATAQRLADLYQRRLVADHAQDLLVALRNAETEAEEITAKASAQFGVILKQLAPRVDSAHGSLTSLADLIPGVVADLKERYARAQDSGNGIAGIPTGFQTLDSMLGGFPPEALVLLAGAPGQGKTTLAGCWAVSVAKAGHPVLFVSYEESLPRLAAKLVASALGLELKRYYDGLSDPASFEEAAARILPGLGSLFLNEGTSKTTVEEIALRFRQIQAKTGGAGGLVILDYLQRACSASGSQTVEYRHAMDGYLAAIREQVAIKLKATVLILAAQSRSGMGSDSISSIRDSSASEYSADLLLTLTEGRRLVPTPSRSVDLNVVKNRLGDRGVVQLKFDPTRGRFTEDGDG